jgi:hypothetical protein
MTTRGSSTGSSVWRWLAWLVLLGVLAVAITSAVTLVATLDHLPGDLVVTVDGEQVDLQALHAATGWLVLGGVVLATVIVLVVVPLSLIFGLGLPLLIAALLLVAGLLIAGVVVAVLGSPLILLGLLLWWAVRPRRATPPGVPVGSVGPSTPPAVPVIGQHTDNQTPFA